MTDPCGGAPRSQGGRPRRFAPRTDGLKDCSRCGTPKPLGDFYVRRASWDGLNAYCKASAAVEYTTPEKRAAGRRRRGEVAAPYQGRVAAQAEAEARKARLRQERELAAVERAAQPCRPARGSAEWYASATAQETADYRRAAADRARRYYAADPEKGRAKVKRWKRANPAVVARHMADRAAREEANADRSITRPARAKLLASTSHCGYCGIRLDPRRTHVDHRIPLARGGAHRIENLVVCCATCNLSKGARTPWEWATAGLPLAA